MAIVYVSAYTHSISCISVRLKKYSEAAVIQSLIAGAKGSTSEKYYDRIRSDTVLYPVKKTADHQGEG